MACLIDRGDLERQRQTWLAGALLHGRTLLVHRGITDVIGYRIVPVSERPVYGLGSSAADSSLLERIEDAMPHSLCPDELARSLQQTALLHRDLVADWAVRRDSAAPPSPLAPGVLDALDKLVAGNGVGIDCRDI